MSDLREKVAGCHDCTKLLSEGLDLCVRARRMDAMDRRALTLAASVDPEAWEESDQFGRHVERHNARFPDRPISTRSATLPMWVQDQYEKDLVDWERRSRSHLTTCPALKGGEESQS